MSKALEMSDDGEAEFSLPLDPSWKHGHVLAVDATIVDANQREQRASRNIVLGHEEEGDVEFKLSLDRDEVQPGEQIAAVVTGPDEAIVSLITFKLESRFELPENAGPAPAGNPFLAGESIVQAWDPRQRFNQRPGAGLAQQRIAREFHSVTPVPKRVDGQSISATSASFASRRRGHTSFGRWLGPQMA